MNRPGPMDKERTRDMARRARGLPAFIQTDESRHLLAALAIEWDELVNNIEHFSGRLPLAPFQRVCGKKVSGGATLKVMQSRIAGG